MCTDKRTKNDLKYASSKLTKFNFEIFVSFCISLSLISIHVPFYVAFLILDKTITFKIYIIVYDRGSLFYLNMILFGLVQVVDKYINHTKYIMHVSHNNLITFSIMSIFKSHTFTKF